MILWATYILDSQDEFNDTFGIQPRMYHAFEQDEEAHNARKQLQCFVDACKLNVFISVCQMDYVGTDTADTTFYIQDVCNEISQFRQVWKDGKVRTFTDNPEDLYQK